ncbi:DUF3999 family protein [Rufibacter roseus]|uniref:DUF3999 family protein n=1 Tax=Rufibacter roseus TaxID=1567108 RepID=A0ABW2DHY4_9BACT|nr:DUF3999 family protein [Rufibacter roseus]
MFLPLMPKSLFLLTFCLFTLFQHWVQAQDFRWQAQVDPVSETGYYRVLLPAPVVGRLQPDATDIRLYRPDGQEVPYVLRAEKPVQYRTLFKPYQILNYTRRQGGTSELIIHNPDRRTINNISLVIGNADVRQEVSLSGSDNQQDWYVLKAQDVLYSIRSAQSTNEVKLLDFPLSNYKYFRLQLNDSTSAPLNILRAGYYDTQSETGKYTTIPVKAFTRTDSAKTTYLHLNFGQPMYPEQVVFHISGPQLYHRTGKVILGERRVHERRRRKRRRRSHLEEISVPLVLHSNSPAVVDLPRQKVEELKIQIDNADNPPLDIDSVKVLHLNQYLVAQLEANKPYTLRFGDEDSPAPEYDLAYFKDSIPANPPVVTVSNITTIQTPEKKKSAKGSTYLIWAAIAIVAVGLGFMTRQLLRDMNQKKEK